MLTLESFSERLNIAIKKSGMTQAALAEKAGTSAANISNYCRGKSFPPIDTLEEIARALNVSIDSLCNTETNSVAMPIKSLGDIARLIASFADWKYISFSHELRRCRDDDGDIVEWPIPTIVFSDYHLCTFINDMNKMKQLLNGRTFDREFYNRWLDDRLKTLSGIVITTDNYGMYNDPEKYNTDGDGELPF